MAQLTYRDAVARGMAVFVVVGLEVVDVDHQQREAGAVAIGTRPLLLQSFVEPAAIPKAGSPLMPLEILHRTFVSLCGRSALERAQVFPFAGLRIGLARIEAELSRREFSNHRCSSRSRSGARWVWY